MDLVEKIRRIYLENIIIENGNKEVIDELEKLKECENINRFMELVDFSKSITEYNGAEILKKTVHQFGNKTLDMIDCNIYVYLGSYYENGHIYMRDDTLCYDKRDSDYLLFKKLMNYYDIYKIFYEEDEEFENDKIIIKFKDDKFTSFSEYDNKYEFLRTFYFKGLMIGFSEGDILSVIICNKEKFGIRDIIVPDRPKVKKL